MDLSRNYVLLGLALTALVYVGTIALLTLGDWLWWRYSR